MTEAELRSIFDASERMTVGLEEEVFLVDPFSFELEEVAAVATAPGTCVGDAIADLRAGRERLLERAAGRVRAIAAGAHPCVTPVGDVNTDALLVAAGSRLGCALRLHIALGSADATLRVYNALRGFLPELAALAANAPFFAGRDSGYASVRPLIETLLSRQGIPPAIPSWGAFGEMLQWAGDPRSWWFELRPHPEFGTLELRVCDAQTTVGEAAAIAAYAHALVAWLAESGADDVPDTWRIAENRFAAARHGLDAVFRDLRSGEPRPVREIVRDRARILTPFAQQLGCADELAALSVESNGASRQRIVGLGGVMSWLADRFLR